VQQLENELGQKDMMIQQLTENLQNLMTEQSHMGNVASLNQVRSQESNNFELQENRGDRSVERKQANQGAS